MSEPFHPPADEDVVDQLLQDWARERPDLDISAMAVVGRLLNLGGLLQARAGDYLRSYGIGYTELDVLATLRRSGAPYRLRPSMLRKSVLLTSGAMTACLDRLEKRGLIYRCPDEADRRSLMAALTERGVQLIDAAIVTHFEAAERTVNMLGREQRAELAQVLRRLRLQLE